MRAALITGASRGSAGRWPRRWSRTGWAVVIDARGETEEAAVADGVAGARRQAGRPGAALAGDVADPAIGPPLVAAATELGRLDLLVNNASVLGPSPQPTLADYPLDVARRVYRVNVVAPLGLVQRRCRCCEPPPARSSTSRRTPRSRATRAGAATARRRRRWSRSATCSPPSSPTCASTGSTRVTCARPMHQEAFPG